jgi:SAM-dependent methyltransferase
MDTRVDYDDVAPSYASRYRRNDYSGVAHTLLTFLGDAAARLAMLEVGCGTGHWIEMLRTRGARILGIDRSDGMLRVAAADGLSGSLIQAKAEACPFLAGSFDRLFCINALHHFLEPRRFFDEARRLLRPGGGILTVGLDPHTGTDRWWIYDYYPTALEADRRRYPAADRIRHMLRDAAFHTCETRVAQHTPQTLRVDDAEREGYLSRTSTSQLTLLPDDVYRSGLARLKRDATAGVLSLTSDLTIYATTAWC